MESLGLLLNQSMSNNSDQTVSLNYTLLFTRIIEGNTDILGARHISIRLRFCINLQRKFDIFTVISESSAHFFRFGKSYSDEVDGHRTVRLK